MTLVARATAAFVERFGCQPTVIAEAPGRVNLIGEHTDYNDGFVLPCAIDRSTVIAARARSDTRWIVHALDYDDVDQFDVHEVSSPTGDGHWSDYVRGVAVVMRDHGVIAGADIVVTGDVPQGAGLSSSASIEVATASLIAHLADKATGPAEIAKLAQRAENEFVGCNCGIMDQMVSASARADHALLLDCRDLSTRHVPLPDDWAVMILHSCVERGLVDSAYNERRTQCEAAARHYGVAALRDLDVGRLKADSAGLDDLVFRRARHVVTENARTLAAADALTAGDLAALGTLMRESHASMRDDFEITVPPIDALAALVDGVLDGAGGARMTGGGFGGCVVAVMPRSRVAEVEAAVAAGYRAPNGAQSTVFICRASGGATVIPASTAA